MDKGHTQIEIGKIIKQRRRGRGCSGTYHDRGFTFQIKFYSFMKFKHFSLNFWNARKWREMGGSGSFRIMHFYQVERKKIRRGQLDRLERGEAVTEKEF